jgi:uncharacterized membrane protein
MATSHNSVTIARPVEDVFAVLSDVENASAWSENTFDEHLITPGPIGVGTRRRAKVKGPFGRPVENEAEMVVFEPNRRMVIRLEIPRVTARIVIDYLPVEEGTRIDWASEFELPVVLRPLGGAFGRYYQRTMQRDLENLKELMESGRL